MQDLDHIAVIITAAGRGTRMGGAPKQWRDLDGRSVLARSIDAFAGIGRIVVTVNPEDMAHAVATLGGTVTLVAGGDSRSDSVRAGLGVLEGSGITAVGAESGYIRSMTKGDVTYGEFTSGPNSGWLYKVNGRLPSLPGRRPSPWWGPCLSGRRRSWCADPPAERHRRR